MKKRIISLLVVLSLICSCLIFTGYANNEGTFYEPYEKSLKFLKALKIIGDEIDVDAVLTRKQAAVYISSMLDENNNFLEYRGIFTDVLPSNIEAQAIEKLADLGIVQGDGNLCFRPDDSLTYNEALRILINALGYGVMKDIDSNYIQIAQREKLTDNIKRASETVNAGDFIIMMNNALMASPFVQVSYGANGAYNVSEQTLLYKIYEVMYARGIFAKNDLTYLWSSQVDDDTTIGVEISESSKFELRCSNISEIRNDLGKSIEVYYKYNKDRDEYDYIYHTVNAVNKILNIDFSQIEFGKTDITKSEISYYPSNSETLKTVRLASSVNLIFNNAKYKYATINLNSFKNKAGNIELIDANSDGAYETAKIKAYNSLVVGNKSVEYNFIEDKFDRTLTVNIDEDLYEKTIIYDNEGNEINLSDIPARSVISVATSDVYSGKNYQEIRVSTSMKNGKVTKYKTKNTAEPYVEIDYENTYKLYDRALNYSYSGGKSIISYIDVFGNIIYTSDDFARDMQYGLIVMIDNGNSKGLASSLSVRFINSAGEIIEAKLDENIVIDGYSFKSNLEGAYAKLSAVSTTLSGVTLPNNLIPMRYKMGTDGVIKRIDTADSFSKNDSDTLEMVCGGYYVGTAGATLGWKYPYSSDALVIGINAYDLSDPEQYLDKINVSVGLPNFNPGGKYSVLAYKSDKESSYADFIICFSGTTSLTHDQRLFIVDEVVQTYDSQKEQVLYQLNGYLAGTYTEVKVREDYASKDELINLSFGDVIRYIVGVDGCISDHDLILTHNGETVNHYAPKTGSIRKENDSWSSAVICGYINKKENVWVYSNDFPKDGSAIAKIPSDVDWENTDMTCIGITGAIPILTVDMSDERIRPGSIDDILDYESFANDASLILMKFRGEALTDVIIYNK